MNAVNDVRTINEIETIIIGTVQYYLPADIKELQLLINEARHKQKKIRIRGSYHSVPAAVDSDSDGLFVMLSHMNKVVIDKSKKIVTVEAGCHLGYDKVDPTGTSTPGNSLFVQLDVAGFALPDMGGIIHQTVGGFLSTGAAGGSLKDTFNESLQEFTFIPADKDFPDPITVSCSDLNTDLFYAMGVSMGLLGIIVSATFSIIPRFNIRGKELTTTFSDCSIDMSGLNQGSKKSLHDFLLQTDFKRLFWYPQPRVSKVVVWQARKMQPDEDEYFIRKPYKELSRSNQVFAGIVFRIIGHSSWIATSRFWNKLFYTYIFPAILFLFVRLDKKDAKEKPVPRITFEDYWYSSLPMDNSISDKLFPVKFTELWIPFDDDAPKDIVAEVLQELNNLFQVMYKDGEVPHPGGDFCIELVAGKKSKFWMSPAYGSKNVLRVDVFWFGKNAGSPSECYYPLFWNALQKFNFRCHWGKYLPDANGSQGAHYLRSLYPRWDDFMNLRKKYDPENIFLTAYWKEHLGLQSAVNSTSPPRRGHFINRHQ